MNKLGDNFEDAFKKAFDDAEWSPPSDLWSGIEEKLDLNKRVGIEESFRMSFISAEITPPDDIWLRIEKDLRNRKIRLWTFRSLGVVAVLLLSFGFAELVKDSQDGFSFPPAKNVSDKSTSEIVTADKEKVSEVQNKVATENPHEITFENKAINATSHKTEEINSSEEKNGKKSVQTFVKRENEPTNVKNTSTKSNKNIHSDNTSRKTEVSENSSKTAPVTEKAEEKTASNLGEIAENNVISPVKRIDAHPLPLVLLPEEVSEFLVMKVEGELHYTAKGVPIKRAPNNGFFVGLQSGIGSFSPNYAFGSALNSSLIQGADSVVIASEMIKNQPQGSVLSTGVDFGYHFGKKLYIVSGFDFARTNAVFSHTPFVKEKNIDPDFQTDSVMRADPNQVIFRSVYLSIPLMLEKHFGQKRLRFVLSGGGVLMYTAQNAYISEKTRYAYNFGNQNSFNSALALGAGVNYAVNDKLHVSLLGDYRTALRNFSTLNGMKSLPDASQVRLRLRYVW